MIEFVAAMVLSTSLSVSQQDPAAAPTPVRLSVARAGVFGPTPATGAAGVPQQEAATADPVRDGAKKGAIAGGLAGVVLGAAGCGAAQAASAGWGGQQGGCGGAILVLGAVGAGVGALIGVGVDAMFERAPGPDFGPASHRRGLRVRVSF